MSYTTPRIVELGTLVTSTLTISTVQSTVIKDQVANTDAGFLATILQGDNPRTP